MITAMIGFTPLDLNSGGGADIFQTMAAFEGPGIQPFSRLGRRAMTGNFSREPLQNAGSLC
ncbi:MAG: hypothetical protein ACLFVH_13865 [Phycisphaerae bacterium]